MQKLSLQQKLLQKLSPQQIQVIKLLELPALQLEQRIKKELEENPALEEGAEAELKVQLMGCGTILREVREAAVILREEFGIESDVWSTTSINELRRDAMSAERYNLLHPEATPQVPYVTECLQDRQGPVIASTDYMRLFADQLREYIPKRYKVLGTDGYGRSDTRSKLREFFEVNRYYVVLAALKALQEEGKLEASVVAKAMQKFNINPDKPAPWTV